MAGSVSPGSERCREKSNMFSNTSRAGRFQSTGPAEPIEEYTLWGSVLLLCGIFHCQRKLPFILNKRFGAGGIGRSGAPGDIRILEAREMPPDFHARFSCRGKTYRYIIERNGDIFRRNMAFQLADSLDHAAMREGAKFIVGTHDFKSFEASGGNPRETTVRTISDLTIEEEGDRTVIEVTGDGFLYNMVRIMVGTLVEVGTGKRTPDQIRCILDGRDRQLAGFTAPPQGLYLKEIYFK